MLSSGPLRGKARPSRMQKALWRSTEGPAPHFGAAVSTGGQLCPRHCPDLWLSSCEDLERYFPNGNAQKGHNDPQRLPSSQSSRMYWETEPVYSAPQEPWVAQDILGHELYRRDHLWMNLGMHRRQPGPHSGKYLRSSQRPQHKRRADQSWFPSPLEHTRKMASLLVSPNHVSSPTSVLGESSFLNS